MRLLLCGCGTLTTACGRNGLRARMEGGVIEIISPTGRRGGMNEETLGLAASLDADAARLEAVASAQPHPPCSVSGRRKSGCEVTSDDRGVVWRCYSSGRYYGMGGDNDPSRTFAPRNHPSTLCAWLVTFAIIAAMAAFGAIGAHCSQPAPAAAP